MIRAILFDADGVTQVRAEDLRSMLGRALNGAPDIEGLVDDIFDAEKVSLTGERDFILELSQVLDRRSLPDRLEEVNIALLAIEVDQSMTDAVQVLRASEIGCYLASNQQPARVRYLSEELGYKDIFDKEFYSCTVGHAKPEAAYFNAILDDIRVPGRDVLFIDDHETNVNAARDVGNPRVTFRGAIWNERTRRTA